MAASEGDHPPLRVFDLAPRRLGKADLVLTEEDLHAAGSVRPGFDPTGLSLDGAARIALLLAAFRDESGFAEIIEVVCRTADGPEQVAVYRGLAVYPGGTLLGARDGEGVRSGIRPVFEAVAHRNPYPGEHLDEAAWNGMVLKALFVGSALAPIQGLLRRANPDFATALLDLVDERRSAGRRVSPELWPLVAPFAGARALAALRRALAEGDEAERLAAAEALGASSGAETASVLTRLGVSETGPRS